MNKREPVDIRNALRSLGIALCTGDKGPDEHLQMFAITENSLSGVRNMQYLCHELAKKSGWWNEYFNMPEQYRKHFIGAKMALVHSEVSEAVEGERKDKMDDHLTDRKAIEVELADAVIRIFDIAGVKGLDIGGAILEKLAYNQQRADHKLDNRAAEGGKKF